MSQGDDQGLILPPKTAPIQVIIVPIFQTQSSQIRAIARICDRLKEEMDEVGIRVKVDDREEKTVGWKFNEWELKGVPIRIEVCESEIKSGELTIYRRDLNQKSKIKNQNVKIEIKKLLEEMQKNLFEARKKFVEDNTFSVDNYAEFKEIMKTKRGLMKAFWCENSDCETKIKAETKATTRVLPLDAKEEEGKCIYCGKSALHRWYFAQAY